MPSRSTWPIHQFGNQPIQEGVVKRGLVIEQVEPLPTPPAAVGVR
ncbi:hypothetical protein WJ966_00055 [Achromobacter xylosoxidans]